MRRPTPQQAMAFLWVALAVALGSILATQIAQHRQRMRESHGWLAEIERNPGFFLSDDAIRQLEKAVRHIPEDPDLAAALSWTRALRVAFLGEDAEAWQKTHVVAAARMKNAMAAAPISRIRLAGAPLLVRTRTAETRGELLANLQEALQLQDDWPGSSTARLVAAAAAFACGEDGLAQRFLSGPVPEPFSWLRLEAHLSSRNVDEALQELHGMPAASSIHIPWREWIRCRHAAGQGEAPERGAAEISRLPEPFPVVLAWKQLTAACLKHSQPEEARKSLRQLPPLTSPYQLESAMRLALEVDDMEAFETFKAAVVRRHGEHHPRLRALAHVELMQRMEPDLAWESLAELPVPKPSDRAAAAAAFLSGHGKEMESALQLVTDLPIQDWMATPPKAGDLARLQERAGLGIETARTLPDPVLAALWLHFALSALDADRWGTADFETDAGQLKKAIERLPQQSSWVMKKAAQLGILLPKMDQAAHALVRLCGDGDADFARNPHFCTAWIADPEVRDLYGRYLTAEEDHAIPAAWVWDWMETNVPAAAAAAGNDWFWQLRRLRYFLRVSPGHGKEVAEKAAAWKHLETHENREVRLEYALLLAALGDHRAASALAADPAMPLLLARRLAHHLIQNDAAGAALPMLTRILNKPDLSPRARLEFERLRARARLALGQDATADWESVFGRDPCLENAALLLQSHMHRRDRNCRRIHELLERFSDHPLISPIAEQARPLCP